MIEDRHRSGVSRKVCLLAAGPYSSANCLGATSDVALIELPPMKRRTKTNQDCCA